ncbi:MAG: sporulation protein YtfJ [Clostridia bacterium]|nr:sporulation protein YtfJ [Clostridia bacterium]
MANTDNKLEDMIATSLESLRTLVDSDTIVGKPITTDVGTTIIPISKISMGYTTGGLEYFGKNSPQKQSFGGGGGTGMTISPVCFLVVDKEGNVSVVNMAQGAPAPDPVEQIASAVERAPELIEKIKAIFKKKETPAEDSSEQPSSEA